MSESIFEIFGYVGLEYLGSASVGTSSIGDKEVLEYGNRKLHLVFASLLACLLACAFTYILLLGLPPSRFCLVHTISCRPTPFRPLPEKRLDLPTLIYIHNQVHEPPNLFDQLSSMLHCQPPSRLYYRTVSHSPSSHRRYVHDCWSSSLPILGMRIDRCFWSDSSIF
jgi:hypothetical protein